MNGGRDPYFGNKENFDHTEVILTLDSLGAKCQSNILNGVLAYYLKAQKEMPNDHDEYIVREQEYKYESQMSIFDQQFYDCRPEIEIELLENYLNMNESEFIKWVP